MLIKYSLAAVFLMTSAVPAFSASQRTEFVVAQATQEQIQEQVQEKTQERSRKQLYGAGDVRGEQKRVREQDQDRSSSWSTSPRSGFGGGSRSGGGGGRR